MKTSLAAIRRGIAAVLCATVITGAFVIGQPTSAEADSPGASTAGRQTGSGKLGYIGDLQLPTGVMFPYGISISPLNNDVVVADSGKFLYNSLLCSLSAAYITKPENAWNGSRCIVGSPARYDFSYEGVDPLRGEYTSGGQYSHNGLSNNPTEHRIGAGSFAENWGAPTKVLLTGANATDEYLGPRGIIHDQAGNIFVADSDRGRVFKYDPNGVFISEIGVARGGWKTAVDVDSFGNLYVSNSSYAGVDVYTNSGTLISSFQRWNAAFPPGSIDQTSGIAVDGDYLYIGDISTGRSTGGIVQRFLITRGGDPVTALNPGGWALTYDPTFGTGGYIRYNPPSNTEAFGVDVDLVTHNVYLWNQQGIIKEYTQNGTYVQTVGTTYSTVSNFRHGGYSGSRGMTIDKNGWKYLTTNTGSTSTPSGNTGPRIQVFGYTPSPMTAPTATPSPTSVQLSWSLLPQDLQGAQYGQGLIKDYVVEYRAVGASSWTVLPTAASATNTTATISGLAQCTAYETRVTAWNEAGSGDPSAAVPVTTTGAACTATPAIDVVKTGNGDEAPTAADAIEVTADSAVSFSYLVTNTGNVALSAVDVVDDQGVVVTFPAGFDGTLDPGESVTATGSGTVPEGDYVNMATASGTAPDLSVVTDTSEWHGTGVIPPAPAITVVKTGNGVQAPTSGSAVQVVADSSVAFSYVVTNTGNVALSAVDVVDDQGVAVTFPAGFDGTLDPGESITATGSGIVPVGDYVNVATATASTGSSEVSDTDEWHGMGTVSAAPNLTVTKSGNGVEAPDASSAAEVVAGSDVVFQYTVTNIGNVPLHSVEVVDDHGVAITFPTGFDGTLDPGESITGTGTGPVDEGDYVNVATASATADDGTVVTGTAEWHGTGVVTSDVNPSIDVIKDALGEVALTESDEVHYPTGTAIQWRYHVINIGNVPITDIEVSDDQGVSVSCTVTELAPGEETLCYGTGSGGTGHYRNIATASGVYEGAATPLRASGIIVADSTEWHGYGDPVGGPSGSGGSDDLAATGASVGVAAIVVLLMIGGGFALTVVRRRRSEDE